MLPYFPLPASEGIEEHTKVSIANEPEREDPAGPKSLLGPSVFQ